MATQLTLPTVGDVAALVDALLVAADTREGTAPAQAAGWRDLAHRLGDALDALPAPTGVR